MDLLGLPDAVVGGISMGAAVALKVALSHPSRVRGLVLSRPARIDRPLPENTRVYTHVARYILHYGVEEGLEHFRRTEEYQEIERESPECARSLELQFSNPRAEECIARLERLPHDAPCHDRSELAVIRVPTLVLGNRRDPIHPWEFAEVFARTIPGAELRELTPKAVSVERHAADVQAALEDFLGRHFLQAS